MCQIRKGFLQNRLKSAFNQFAWVWNFSRLFFKSVSLYQPNFEPYKVLEAMKLSNETQSIDQNHLWTIISKPFHFTNKTTKNLLCRLQLTVNLDIILFLVTIIIAKSFISFVIWKSIFLWKRFLLLQINQLIQKIRYNKY